MTRIIIIRLLWLTMMVIVVDFTAAVPLRLLQLLCLQQLQLQLLLPLPVVIVDSFSPHHRRHTTTISKNINNINSNNKNNNKNNVPHFIQHKTCSNSSNSNSSSRSNTRWYSSLIGEGGGGETNKVKTKERKKNKKQKKKNKKINDTNKKKDTTSTTATTKQSSNKLKDKSKKKKKKRFGTPRSKQLSSSSYNHPRRHDNDNNKNDNHNKNEQEHNDLSSAAAFPSELQQTSLLSSSSSRRRSPPRRFVVDYSMNRNPKINRYRLLEDQIDCFHSPNCPSCVYTDRGAVSTIPVIQSAKQFFSSSLIRRHRRYNNDNNNNFDDIDDDGDDKFYDVVVPSDLSGWRTEAKLAVTTASSEDDDDDDKNYWKYDMNNDAGCDFGLYRRGSHKVVPIPNCSAHHPSINRAVLALQQATKKCRTLPYDKDEANRGHDTGGLRYIHCRVERSTGKVCLTLVWDSDTLKGTQPYLSRLVKELTKRGKRKNNDDNNNDNDSSSSLWHSIWCHCNDSQGNAIFHRNPNRWHRLMGPEYIREPIHAGTGGIEGWEDMNQNRNSDDDDENNKETGWLYFTPKTFRQGNMEGFDVLAKDVARLHVPSGSKVCELYAGVGLLGLTALQFHHNRGTDLQWIRCSDENPNNVNCFNLAVRSLHPDVVNFDADGNFNDDDIYQESSSLDILNDSNNKEMTIAEYQKRLLESINDNRSTAARSGGDDGVQQRSQGKKGRNTGSRRSFYNNNNRSNNKEYLKATYEPLSASMSLKAGQALGAEVLLVDPPRKGLDDEVLDELCKPYNRNQPYTESIDELDGLFNSSRGGGISWTNDVRKIVYISCGFDALARDTEQLLSSPGRWTLESATGYILFPGSNHVETVCIFTRDGGGGSGGGSVDQYQYDNTNDNHNNQNRNWNGNSDNHNFYDDDDDYY